MAKRSFNYTNRVRINKSDFSITLYEREAGYDLIFQINQREYSFPKKAVIIAEAYVGANLERILLGTWEKPLINAKIRVASFNRDDAIKFRLKIVNEQVPERTLLGYREAYSPVTLDRKGKNIGILPARPTDLGHRIWALDWQDATTPRLLINKRISDAKDISAIARADPDFLSLVYPEATRLILTRLIREGNLHEEDSDWARWCSKYTRICAPEIHDESDGDEYELSDEVETWIDSVITAFCKEMKIIRKYSEFKRS